MLERAKTYLYSQWCITDEWADLVTDGKDAEYRKIRDTQGPEAAKEWLNGQERMVRHIAKRPRI